MERPSKMIITSAVATCGIAVLLATGVALERSILEQWYLWKLESEDEQDREVAAEKLGVTSSGAST